MKLYHQVGKEDDIHIPGELQCPPSSISLLPGSINKACFVRSMNEDGFLLCILLKLESYGLLPLMTPIGFQQPNVQIWLTSYPPNSTSVILTSGDIQQVCSFYHEGFSTVMEQIKGSLYQRLETQHETFLHTVKNWWIVHRVNKRLYFWKADNTKVLCSIHNHCKNNYWNFRNIKWISWINGLWL